MDPSAELAGDPRVRRREARLATILGEAWTLAHRDGLAAISLRDLAQGVGLRQPSLYAYFDSKLGLYDLLYADGNRQLLAAVRSLDLAGDPRRALVRFVETLVRFSGEDIVRHQMLFQRTIPGFEPSPTSYGIALEFYGLAVERLAVAGVTEAADVDLFSAIVSGLAHQQVANDPGGDRWVRLAGPAVTMFLADVDRRRAAVPGKPAGVRGGAGTRASRGTGHRPATSATKGRRS